MQMENLILLLLHGNSVSNWYKLINIYIQSECNLHNDKLINCKFNSSLNFCNVILIAGENY